MVRGLYLAADGVGVGGSCGSHVLQLYGRAESDDRWAEMGDVGVLGVVDEWSMGILQVAVEDDGVPECFGHVHVAGDSPVCPNTLSTAQAATYVDHYLAFVCAEGNNQTPCVL